STGSTGSGSTGSSGGGSGSSGAATGSSGTSGSGGTSGGSADAGACPNTNTSVINEDALGVVCNNKWNISGAWYCFSDPNGSSTSCPPPGTGIIPYNASSKAMCLSGTTSTAAASAMSYGAALGMQLNSSDPFSDAGVAKAFNAKAQNIVGFAITISGSSGGANLRVDFPGNSMYTSSTGENPGVAIPGVDSGTSPITYNVLFQDAIMSDNTATPIPKIVDPTDVTDVQLRIGVDQIAHQYDFCITNVVPITAAPAAPASLSSYGPAFGEGAQIVLSGLGPYGIQNDPFKVGSASLVTMQASYGNNEVGFSATSTFGSTGNTPGAFPSIVYGWIQGGNFVGGGDTGGYNGGTTIGNLKTVTSTWDFTASPSGGTGWDAAYDCWFGGNSDSIYPLNELMVWANYSSVNPIGGQKTAVTITGGPAGSWTYSTGMNSDQPNPQQVVSYVTSGSGTNSGTFNLLPFFQDAASHSRAGLSTGSFFLGCQTGFEIYGAGTWKTNSFTMSAN
ncbi:MAG TPA: hypothetical protein VK841_25595, partial [Polyangiaceae bacterium]|nr:hypothetical protein [Polyangiaceae bacterium]